MQNIKINDLSTNKNTIVAIKPNLYNFHAICIYSAIRKFRFKENVFNVNIELRESEKTVIEQPI